MKARQALNRLAESRGVETSYIDITGRRRFASGKALRAVLRALGPEPARRGRAEPVRVAWDGALRGSRRRLPWGYHRVNGSLVISAPRRSFRNERRSWGLFLPLYGLHSKRNTEAGDLADLAAFARWAGKLGADWVGTLPLLGQFLGKPWSSSPYSPVSRLFWSEFWLDTGGIKSSRRSDWVDYRRLMKAKWRVLEREAKRWAPPPRWLREHPETLEYAEFRAAKEKKKAKTFLYAQWLVERQMERLRRACRRAGVGLYFDLPLGSHPAGYDVWKERESFVRGMHVGAPPDPFFTGGQDWGFPPPHPERIREQGYDYFIRCLRHSMRHASMLRLDHVMGLHRLFWVPAGMPAREGVYVRYRPEEFYAILSLESHRNRCMLVGEDLGTVPPEVRRSMRRHRLSGMFVVQYEWNPNSRRPLPAAPRGSLACLNTHDMPPFAAFWKKQLAPALLKRLAAGPAAAVLVNPEDLWGETRPHNVPGTRGGRNWRRKARFSLEQMRSMKVMTRHLKEINRLRVRKTAHA